MSSPKTILEPARTFGELKQSGYQSISVKDELRANLIKKLRAGEKLFRGIVGYDETVIPQLVNAILAKHNVILLGLRGQAKSRIIRQLTELLNDEIPIVAGSEVNDDPFHPISAYGRQTLAVHGDSTHIDWVGRDSRFVEKLATPDVTIADIIGDVDPIKAAKGGHLLSDELTIHYGLLPRANRCIFNIMQEGDVQIKGYPVRLPLDVMLIFSANPEDYTARGKIITPLKDRIGTEIMTHYPAELQTAVEITRQEAWVSRAGLEDADGSALPLNIPEFIRELVEQIAFEARDDSRVDKHSGVSQRMPITVIESLLSNAERRALLTDEQQIVPRISDIYAAIPSMTGKMELEYEGEQIGASRIAKDLIKRAAGEIFEGYFVGIDFAQTVQWFEQGNNLRLADTASAQECRTLLDAVPELIDASVIPFDFKESDTLQLVAACEFVLEGLYAENKISRNEEGGYTAVTKAKKDRRGMIYDDLTETGKYS